MRMYPVRINNSTYRNNAGIISALKPQVGKFIGYRLDEDGDIRRIVFIDTKTPKDKYKVKADTKYFIKNGTYYQISDLPSGYTYSYEVLSYDKEYNALSVVVTDMYKYGMEFFTAYNDYCCYTKDENGKTNCWDCDDRSLFNGISPNSMIQFTYNEDWDEFDPVIFDRRIPYKEDTAARDYTVTGFVWNDNLSPMYPADPVWD